GPGGARGGDGVGLYVLGAAPTAHLAWRYTGGASQGELAFTLPASLAAGTYELRLFAADGHEALAHSAPFAVAAAGDAGRPLLGRLAMGDHAAALTPAVEGDPVTPLPPAVEVDPPPNPRTAA